MPAAGSAMPDSIRCSPNCNRRKAIVYVHPTNAACCTRLIPEVADTLIEYGTDTTRAIASYVYRGAARRFPDVRMIWSHSARHHALSDRAIRWCIDRSAAATAQAPDGFRASIGRFWYDIAQASNAVATDGAANRGADGTYRVRHRLSFPHLARARDRGSSRARSSIGRRWPRSIGPTSRQRPSGPRLRQKVVVSNRLREFPENGIKGPGRKAISWVGVSMMACVIAARRASLVKSC